MKSNDVLRAWGRILAGRSPSLSIEITRECPLRCPGCYAYEDGHVGDGNNLRQLADKKGEALIEGVLKIVDDFRPLHLSIVGGDPLVRFRELDALLPLLSKRGVHVQLVTSARRKPATYERILKNIQGHHITIHCTVTAQMMQRPRYLQDFLEFWSTKDEVNKVWISFFTPQKGASAPEMLTPEQRALAVQELLVLRELYPKLDMPERVVREFLRPPASPEQCIFAQTTTIISADLKTQIVPCQFGGDPDCSQCGCLASMGLAALGHRRLAPGITLGSMLKASMNVGSAWKKISGAEQHRRQEELTTISWKCEPVASDSKAPARIEIDR